MALIRWLELEMLMHALNVERIANSRRGFGLGKKSHQGVAPVYILSQKSHFLPESEGKLKVCVDLPGDYELHKYHVDPYGYT